MYNISMNKRKIFAILGIFLLTCFMSSFITTLIVKNVDKKEFANTIKSLNLKQVKNEVCSCEKQAIQNNNSNNKDTKKDITKDIVVNVEIIKQQKSPINQNKYKEKKQNIQINNKAKENKKQKTKATNVKKTESKKNKNNKNIKNDKQIEKKETPEVIYTVQQAERKDFSLQKKDNKKIEEVEKNKLKNGGKKINKKKKRLSDNITMTTTRKVEYDDSEEDNVFNTIIIEDNGDEDGEISNNDEIDIRDSNSKPSKEKDNKENDNNDDDDEDDEDEDEDDEDGK